MAASAVELKPLYEIGCGCGRCKKKTQPEMVEYCGTCVQIAYCSADCLQAHATEHSLNCVPISPQNLGELQGFAGYCDLLEVDQLADDAMIERRGGGGRSGGGSGRGGGRSPSPRLSPPRGGSPRMRPVSPTRFRPGGGYRPRGYYPRFDPGRRFLPGILPAYWGGLSPRWRDRYSFWYRRGGLPIFGLPGLPLLPPWVWVDDLAAVDAQLAYLNATYSYPGAYIAPDPVNQRFIWVRA